MSSLNIILDSNQIINKKINLKYIDENICKNPNPKTKLLFKENPSLIREDYLLKSEWGVDYLFEINLIKNICSSDLNNCNNNKVIYYLLENSDLLNRFILKNNNQIICDIILLILENKEIPEEYKKYSKSIKLLEIIIEKNYYELFENKNKKIINYLFKKHFVDKNYNDIDIYYKSLLQNNTEKIVNYILENKIKDRNIFYNKNEKITNYILENNYFDIYDNYTLFKILRDSENITLVNNFMFYYFKEYKINYTDLYKLIFSKCLKNNKDLVKFVIDNINFDVLDIDIDKKNICYSYITLNHQKLTGEKEDESFYEYWYNKFSTCVNCIHNYKIKIKLLYNDNIDYDITQDDIYN